MKIIIVPTLEDVGPVAAEEIWRALRSDPVPVLGVATGSTPLPVYDALAGDLGAEPSSLTVFGLDEYIGLPATHPESYHAFVHAHVTVPLGLDPLRVHLPDGMASDPDHEAVRYEEAIREAGGISIQILGIGTNGHIGFNEPLSSLASRTRAIQLASQTRRDNARFFSRLEEVPQRAITQGIGTIVESRRLLLLATGLEKALALSRAIEGPIAANCPASAIQLHPDVTVIADAAAASQLSHSQLHDAALI